MIKININLIHHTYYTHDYQLNPAYELKNLFYYYPLNEGIIINSKEEIIYQNISMIRKHFEKIEPMCFCILDIDVLNVNIITENSEYISLLRKLKIKNILYENDKHNR